MIKLLKTLMVLLIAVLFINAEGCIKNDTLSYSTSTAGQEQASTEANQSVLLSKQPAPRVTWSMERDALDMRFKMMNDRGIVFYMYVFAVGSPNPIGYYQVNKVSSVNSQLTNPEQLVYKPSKGAGSTDYHLLPSPAEDGSYGTNGDAVFSFTPENIYIEHNMQYIVASVPLKFTNTVNKLVDINVKDLKAYQLLMEKISK